VESRVANNAPALQYEIEVGGAPAGLIRYTRDGDVVTLVHTEVEPRFEGRGVGSALIRGALDDLRARGQTVRPVCPFVRAYIERHPEYADLEE
jgi:predicted GNAT family acetyltransferase